MSEQCYKQRHKSGSKTHVTQSTQNKGGQSDIYRDSLFPRDNRSNDTNTTTFNNTTLSIAVGIGPEQVTRCQIYDVSHSVRQSNLSNHQKRRHVKGTVAPKRTVNTESLRASYMSEYQL